MTYLIAIIAFGLCAIFSTLLSLKLIFTGIAVFYILELCEEL